MNDVKPIVLATILKYADEEYCRGLYHGFTGRKLPDGLAGDEVFELAREAFLASEEKLLSYLGPLTDDAWNVMLAAIRDGDQTFRCGEGDFTSRKRYESCARSLSSCPYAMVITDDYGNTFFKLADEIRQKWRANLDTVISARTSWNRTYRMAEACVNGKPAELYTSLVRKAAAIPRNAPCPCGSGKKSRMCCGKDQ